MSALLHVCAVALFLQFRPSSMPAPVADTGWAVVALAAGLPAVLREAAPLAAVPTPVTPALPAAQITLPPPAPLKANAEPPLWAVKRARNSPIVANIVSNRPHSMGQAPQPATAPPAPVPPSPSVPLANLTQPSPTPPDDASITALEQRISRAVDDAKFYPSMARQTHREGRVAISFNYRDGAVGEISLQQSSQFPVLDKAAMAAVRLARYPSPPSGLNGYPLRLTIWVQFSLVALE